MNELWDQARPRLGLREWLRAAMREGEGALSPVPEWKRGRREVAEARHLYWGRFHPRAWDSPITPEAMRGELAWLNVGCGRDVRPEYLNLDARPYPGVAHGLLQLGGLPITNGRVSFVYAHHVLEHVVDFGSALQEVHRVLKPGGVLEACVPFRTDNENPYHLRRFTHRSLWAVIGPGNTLEGTPRAWTVLHIGITRRGFPWVQVQRAIGRNLPVGRRLEMTFVLQKA